ncbi:sensor histidine kinase [Geothrix sp. 21YS21S-2]|uniref:sensor histidine kinase n=1 Tax=Geothrix sp. 21YS21S-2 TaxID=3068893 RepID=UPI0027B97BB9|nr:histidine kinase [Geothrix sp. 21YS21S-2]
MWKSRVSILACYLLWVLAVLVGHGLNGRLGNPWLWGNAVISPFTHVVTFVFLAPLPWLLTQRFRTPWAFILGLLLSLAGCELVAAALPFPDAWMLANGRFDFNFRKVVLLYTSLVGPALMVVGGLIAARARSEELREASMTEAQIAKTRLLQSQIHPHVLFNALNGLAELVHKDPVSAERAIHHLSDLLRRILRASEQATFPLGEERSLVTDYLAIESMRLGSRLRVAWEWDDRLDTLEIPPLLLQPLVENAIKHGISPSLEGGDLIVRAQGADGLVTFQIWNSGEPFLLKRQSQGVGVKNLRARLALAYGDEAQFSLGASEGGTLARIELKIL